MECGEGAAKKGPGGREPAEEHPVGEGAKEAGSEESARPGVAGEEPAEGEGSADARRINRNIIRDEYCVVGFSSASLMTTVLKGKTKSDAEVLFKRFHDLVTADMSTTVDEESLGKLAVFAGVREFPARVKCASLAWHTMHAAIANDTTIVSTE